MAVGGDENELFALLVNVAYFPHRPAAEKIEVRSLQNVHGNIPRNEVVMRSVRNCATIMPTGSAGFAFRLKCAAIRARLRLLHRSGMFIAMAFWKKSSERVSQYIMPDPHSAVEIIRERAATLRAGVTAAALAGMLCALSLASYAAELNYPPVQPPLISVDWQNPMSVPLRFRNHCHFDAFGRYYCSNHCGLD